jgi:hypothetical protein
MAKQQFLKERALTLRFASPMSALGSKADILHAISMSTKCQ